MVKERVTDGKRIAQLLASELDGLGGHLSSLSVTDADPDVEPTTDGAFAYAVTAGEGADEAGTEADEAGDATAERIAEVYVQPHRARVEFTVAPESAATAADEAGLRVRPKAVEPPRTLVFVEDGAQVKRVVPVFRTVLASVDGGG